MTPEIRSLFPVTERAIYFNHAAVSPPPITTIRAIEAQLKRRSRKRLDKLPQLAGGETNARVLFWQSFSARAVRAGRVHAQHFRCALNRRERPELGAGDNIVTFSREFPSNIYPWLRVRDAFGVEVRMCDERDGRIDLMSWKA